MSRSTVQLPTTLVKDSIFQYEPCCTRPEFAEDDEGHDIDGDDRTILAVFFDQQEDSTRASTVACLPRTQHCSFLGFHWFPLVSIGLHWFPFFGLSLLVSSSLILVFSAIPGRT